MAELSKTGKPSLATVTPCPAHSISGLIAGVNIAAGDACYIASDGKVKLSTGAAADEKAVVVGFAATDAAAGESVTLYQGVNFRYGDGVTAGKLYYLSGTNAGGLADTASTGGVVPVAAGLPGGRLHVMANYIISLGTTGGGGD